MSQLLKDECSFLQGINMIKANKILEKEVIG